MYRILIFILILGALCFSLNIGCQNIKSLSLRAVVDTVGFAHQAWQIDSIIKRINTNQSHLLRKTDPPGNPSWKVAISPHDDYTYVGYLYPAVINYVKAHTIFLFGVAHKARLLNSENQIIFDDFDAWSGPYGEIEVSEIRDEIIQELPDSLFQINNKMQAMEHSLEAVLPFLQYRNRQIQIVPILVPYMAYHRMEVIARPLAEAVHRVAQGKQWIWGDDYAVVISTDAVHYGDKDWGGKNFAFYGADSAGYKKAVNYEHEIINKCLVGEISPQKIKTFTKYTVQKEDYKEYKWTWCGRYSVPMGLLTSYYLQELSELKLEGRLFGYATSIDHSHIPVDDLKMGVTASANIHHWVGYAAVGYE